MPKPAVCAFNFDLPRLFRNGTAAEGGLNGNSFAGPMFAGSLALMLSADPDLLPWDLRAIITSTAMDVAAEGVDAQTGHGLINCYRAVKEVLRRKAEREGRPTKPYTGRTKDDELDIASLPKRLEVVAVVVNRLGPRGQARTLGIQVGDIIEELGGVPIEKSSPAPRAVEGGAGRRRGGNPPDATPRRRDPRVHAEARTHRDRDW